MRQAVLIFYAVFAVVVSAELKLPRTIKYCQSDADDYESCLRLAIQDAIPKVIGGLPEFDVPAFDPYHIASIGGSYKSGILSASVVVKDSNTYGLSKTRVLSVRPRRQNGRFHLEIDIEIPKVLVEGQYKAEGILNEYRVGGEGFYNVSMEGVTTTWEMDGPVKNDRWVVEHFTMLPKVSKMKVWFPDLFNGNDNLNTAARSFINEFWPLFYREMLPIVAVEWDKELTKFVNRIFSKISFSKTFP